MLHSMKNLLLVLVCAVSLHAEPPPIYLKLVKDVWDTGGVCRNAAAAMSVQAEFEGTPSRVLRYEMNGTEEQHIVFLLQGERCWYAVDAIGKGVHVAVWGRLPKNFDVEKHRVLLGTLIHRPLKRYVEDVGAAALECWMDEPLCFGQLDKKLDATLENIRRIKNFIQLWQKKIENFRQSLRDSEEDPPVH